MSSSNQTCCMNFGTVCCSDTQEHQRTFLPNVVDVDKKFSVCHAEWKKGGLVISRHNEVRDELGDLAAKAFITSAVRDEPRIHMRCREGSKTTKSKTAEAESKSQVSCNLQKFPNEDRGGLLIGGNATVCNVYVVALILRWLILKPMIDARERSSVAHYSIRSSNYKFCGTQCFILAHYWKGDPSNGWTKE